MSTNLLQTKYERLGTLNLVNLPSFTHRLLDDVTIIIVILRGERDTGMRRSLSLSKVAACRFSRLF